MPLEGSPYFVSNRVIKCSTAEAVISRRGRAFLGTAAARVVVGVGSGRDRLPRPSLFFGVMMACLRWRGHRGRGGARSSARKRIPCS
jgi:hypothetical protein